MVGSEASIALIKMEIRETLKDAAYTLDAKHITDGIQKIFDDALRPSKI